MKGVKSGPHGLVFMAIFLGLLLLTPGALSANGEMEDTGFGVQSCGECHGSSPKYPLLGTRLGYDYSGHKNGFENHEQNSYYANGAGCQRCHTHEGFVEYLTTGSVDPEAYVPYPSQPGCFTCHDSHESGDFSLRTTQPVTLVNGATFNLGAANLCANCHQARSDAQKLVKATPADKVRPYWGAHHGPQTDLVNGTNAYQFPGKSYSSSPHKALLKNGCVDCHMNLPQGRYSLSPKVGGHSFNMIGEVHGREKLNIAACQECHQEIKQVAGQEIYSIQAKADYDLDGAIEPFQAEVEGLLDTLVNAQGSGLLQTLALPMYKADGSWNAVREGERSVAEMAALYNYKFILEDRSQGVHNGKYTIQVLYDTIEALYPGFDTAKRP